MTDDLPLTYAQMNDGITRIAGDEGWVDHEAEAAYRQLAARLVIAGLSPGRVYEALNDAYRIVAQNIRSSYARRNGAQN